MYGWTILIIILLSIATLRAIGSKFLPSPQRPVWIIGALVLITIAGGYLTINSSERLKQSLERKNWPIAVGRVIKSEVMAGAIIRPQVIYAYEVDGRAYIDTSDLQVPGFGNRNKQYEVTHAVIAEYPTGKEVSVHYHPEDVTNSVIITTPKWNDYGKVSLGIVLFAGALFLLALPRPPKSPSKP